MSTFFHVFSMSVCFSVEEVSTLQVPCVLQSFVVWDEILFVSKRHSCFVRLQPIRKYFHQFSLTSVKLHIWLSWSSLHIHDAKPLHRTVPGSVVSTKAGPGCRVTILTLWRTYEISINILTGFQTGVYTRLAI